MRGIAGPPARRPASPQAMEGATPLRGQARVPVLQRPNDRSELLRAEGATRAPVIRGEGGFTLLEILVALAILGLAVTVIFQLFSANLRAIRLSEDYLSAAVKAQTKMREVLDNEKFGENSWSETTLDGYRIDVVIAETLKERSKELPVQMLEVVLTVYWKKDAREKALTLRTMKMINRNI